MVDIRQTIDKLKAEHTIKDDRGITKADIVNCDIDRFTSLVATCYYELLLKNGITDMSDESISRVESMAKWFFDGGRKSLVLTGNVGMGKSTLMKATSMAIGQLYFYSLGSQRKTSMYVECAELQTIYDNDQSKFDRLKHCDILFLDDLGVEPVVVSKYGNKTNLFIELLLCRYEEKKPTIITTNLKRNDIVRNYCNSELMQARVEDRLFETYDFKVLQGNESFRIKNAKK